jgi:tellurite resistance protein TerC
MSDPSFGFALPRRNDHGVAHVELFGPLFGATLLDKPLWIWLLFVGIVFALLAFDLGVLHRDQHEIGVRESLWLATGCVAIAAVFGTWVWWYMGAEPGIQYFTGYLIEYSLRSTTSLSSR